MRLLCSYCGKPQIRRQFFALVSCDDCKKERMARWYKEHVNNKSGYRMMKCQYCGQEEERFYNFKKITCFECKSRKFKEYIKGYVKRIKV